MNISLMKVVQYIPVLIKPKYNNILQFNHKAVGVFLSFYIPAYVYIYVLVTLDSWCRFCLSCILLYIYTLIYIYIYVCV